MVNLALMLGGSTGISCYVVLLEQRTEFHAQSLGATQTTANPAMRDMLGAVGDRLAAAGLDAAAQTGMALNYLDSMVSAQATMLGFQDGFLALAIIAVVPLTPVALLMRRR